jgi:hypothetical protein
MQTRRKIVTTKNYCDQHSKSSGGEKDKEKKATQSQEEKEKGEEANANAKEEERQQAELTRRVAGTVAPYIEPPGDKDPR